MKRFVFAMLAMAMPLVGASAQDATNYPDKPIHLLVPFPAGTTTDIVARVVGQALSLKLGKPVVVENRPGASGAIAMNAVATSTPDGYTIGLGTTTTQTVSVTLNKRLPYDPVKDFAPVAMVGGVPYVLVVSDTLTEVNTLGDLIKKAKAKPGDVSYGSVGEASLANLATQLFATEADIELTHIPYKAAGQAALDNVAGRISMQFSTYGSLQAFIREGKLKPLAVSSSKRLSQLPDVPTVAETGLPNYNVTLWFAVVAPKGTPAAVVAKLNKAINDGMAEDSVAATLRKQGVETDPSSPTDLGERIVGDIAKWRNVVKKAGITPR